MECPVCGKENPLIKAAATSYKIPWARHDFIIPYHAWSTNGAISARWFDTKSKALGDEYRDQVFANQSSISTPVVLREFTEKFAKSHGIALPFAIDPQGKLAADVKADSDLGRRTGIDHTPTVFIVTANSKGAPYIEVQHPDQDLYKTIDQALADTPAAPQPTGRQSQSLRQDDGQETRRQLASHQLSNRRGGASNLGLRRFQLCRDFALNLRVPIAL